MADQNIWPKPTRCAVVITVDFNDIHGILTQEPAVAGRDKTLSVWRYGTKRGIDNMLQLFDDLNVHSSWCVPGIVAEENSERVREIDSMGHEIATMGYEHCNFDDLSLEKQINMLEDGCKVTADTIGKSPRGFRISAGNWKPGFTDALRRQEIIWSSSWRGDDLPYSHPINSNNTSPLIEIPLHYELEDEPYFAFNLSPAVPPGLSRIASYSHTLNNMKMDFAGFYKYGLCYVLRLHPEIIGTPGRIGILRELLENIMEKDDVWITTAENIANHCIKTGTANSEDHPVSVYERHYREYI